MKRWIWMPIFLIYLIVGLSAKADQPQEADYAIPGQFSLPWDCGEGYRVSWEPEAHWEHGKAAGIAYDFALPIGVPIYAPISGTAHFLYDERPFETNYGHYIEIVDETGHWLVRLAHLRDPQSGERHVHAGELIGYSGISGVSAAHLHFELLVRDGTQWVRPDFSRLYRLFDLPIENLSLGALTVNQGCPTSLAIDGDVTFLPSDIALGESVDLTVPFYNRGPGDLIVDLVQVNLFSLDGMSVLAEIEGSWEINTNQHKEISVPTMLPAAGMWYVGRVTLRTQDSALGMPARGQIGVAPSPLHFVGVSLPDNDLSVGDQLLFDVWIENSTTAEIVLDDFFAKGVRPDAVSWRASVGEPVVLAPERIERVTLSVASRVQAVGYWTFDKLGYTVDEHEFVIAHVQQEVVVRGPQLVVEQIDLFSSPDTAHVFLSLRNIGTEEAVTDAIEVWGWKPDGDSFSAQIYHVAPLAAGQSALIKVDIPLEAIEGTWRMVEAGYWRQGVYYRMSLPDRPAVAVELAPESSAVDWEPLPRERDLMLNWSSGSTRAN